MATGILLHVDSARRMTAECRSKLLNSERMVRNEIAGLRERAEAAFRNMEQEQLKKLREHVELQESKIEEAERAIQESMKNKGPRRHPRRVCPKLMPQPIVVTFKSNPKIIRLIEEATSLGCVQLSQTKETVPLSSTDTPLAHVDEASNSSVKTASLASSEYFAICNIRGVNMDTQMDTSSASSSFCFVGTGLLSNEPTAANALPELLQNLPIYDSKTVVQSKNNISNRNTSEWNTLFFHSANELFEKSVSSLRLTLLQDSRLVVLQEAEDKLSLYSTDNELLSSISLQNPKTICYTAYDTIAVVTSQENGDVLVFVEVVGNRMRIASSINVSCVGRISGITCVGSKIYLICTEGHIHILDIKGKEIDSIKHMAEGCPLISVEYSANENLFYLVSSDGSISCVDSRGEVVAKQHMHALSVSYINGQLYALCYDTGVRVVEISCACGKITDVIKEEDESTEPLDMSISPDGLMLLILYGGVRQQVLRKYSVIQTVKWSYDHKLTNHY